jgi:hypothetical protein
METNNLFGAFNYGTSNKLTEEVLGLFKGVYEQSLSGHVKEVKYAYDIVNAGMEGRIDFSKEFNLSAYEYRIDNNANLNKYHKRKKESFLDESNNEETSQRGGIQENKVAKLSNSLNNSEADIDCILEKSELMTALKLLQGVQDDFLKTEGVNLNFLIKRAVQGVPVAIERLKELCTEFELLGEQVKIILSSKESLVSSL